MAKYLDCCYDIDEIKKYINPSKINPIRGQSNKDWKLDCSYFRNKTDKYVKCKDLFGLTWTEDMENILKTTFPIDASGAGIKAFPQLSYLTMLQQNYDFKTPLLDVSSNIYMPLFCACGEGKENMDKDGIIYKFEIIGHSGMAGNLENSETRILYSDEIPTYNNRLLKQEGMFLRTMFVKDGDLSFSDITKSGNIQIKEYIIPAEWKEYILRDLEEKLQTNDLYTYFYGEDK